MNLATKVKIIFIAVITVSFVSPVRGDPLEDFELQVHASLAICGLHGLTEDLREKAKCTENNKSGCNSEVKEAFVLCASKQKERINHMYENALSYTTNNDALIDAIQEFYRLAVKSLDVAGKVADETDKEYMRRLKVRDDSLNNIMDKVKNDIIIHRVK